MTPDSRALVDALAFTGHTMRQRELAYALWELDGSIRRVQSACQEARLAGWPIVSDGDGVRLETDPAAVAACALALRKRALHQCVTARALRDTAKRMREPMTVWEFVARSDADYSIRNWPRGDDNPARLHPELLPRGLEWHVIHCGEAHAAHPRSHGGHHRYVTAEEKLRHREQQRAYMERKRAEAP